MDHTPFIIGAYAVALGGVLGIFVQSWFVMRYAEKRAQQMRERGR